ncbi:P-loop containing nucleoside triphosphate hydrolase protein [Aspergillus brunneoviolaceus CBS 621.78]|uniref:P-loop containing nucleoside triphosphate hydrolase protein n=1 Tax=Aspergillus brunneoviolaceus CBS 621.78 TaxID=1450534 RepID=A0ACD1G5S8_9EURO|nr:P-loop containing nucleoside triphosphate hydrolase protein [Aspergillus brunneoviolaceus CBS 621.78]RAH44654.1 P-loop containing nucleoside triphosphate hydrolase protein [Aspergillus brunneoviolaceus CBS 621.78]
MVGSTSDSLKTCYEFAKRGSCRFKRCKYAHVRRNENKARDSTNSTSHRSHSLGDSNELAIWKRQVGSHHYNRPLGGQLGPMFAKARELIELDESTLQDVIQCLSKESGLRRIQELVQRDFDSIPSSAKLDLFVKQMLPFMDVITHPDVLASLVIEQAVGTIYNCLYGVGGRRSEPFLGFLAGAIQQEIETEGKAAPAYLEQSLLVFWKIVELNSTAFVQEPLKAVARQFADLFLILHALNGSDALHQSRDYLDKLQHRLDIGLSLPAVTKTAKQHVNHQPVAFVTQREPPGKRHDNDDDDICNIKVMPTFQEILSPRSEYLPPKDPRQWHVCGLAGLLDRNFRLLREDTIGQLRDAIHAEIQAVDPSQRSRQKGETRTHVYRQVVVQGVEFHRFDGLQFLVHFVQPTNVRGAAKKKLQEWWQLSKRLQPDALVCLFDPRGQAIFCTVAAPDRPRPKSDAAQKQQGRLAGSLSDDPNVASVLLKLVESGESSWQYILDCHASQHNPSPISLVEFPGILLPSFHPTLLALQKMQKAGDVPMAEFLAPQNQNTLSILADVPPPVYAASQNFSFDLNCLMKDHSNLQLHVSQPFDLKMLQDGSTLDDAQALALVSTLRRKIGLIQGPPGTGKSFTGVALIKALLANKAKVKGRLGPIVCVCYTNHALDQLLEDLLDNEITSQIIRIGSQSKSERLQPLNLRNIARGVEKTRMEKAEQWRLHTALDDHEDEFRKVKLNAIGLDHGLKSYLEQHQPYHYAQLFARDADGFQRQTKGKPARTIQSWLKAGKYSRAQPTAIQELAKVHVDAMTAAERKALHAHWIDDYKQKAHLRVQTALHDHLETKASWDRIRDEIALRCLKTADVIGVTSTGLARNLEMLRRLPSKVLVCEEAGEVLEAHLLTSLLPSLEQVILIGDHQQLRPQIQNHNLSRESKAGAQYALDRSLFERLVDPDDDVGVQIPFCTLETQRRMHPSISQLIRDTLYPRLQDAPSVSTYPEVVGVRKRLFWLDHRVPEGHASSEDAMATSHWNDYEIQLTIALVNHLLRQGTYESGDIAVLTPYLGQLHRMRRKLSQAFTIMVGERDQDDLDNAGFIEDEAEAASLDKTTIARSTLLHALRVATIDNFQGEEAKVVVISLVRSNNQNRCGFLRTPNRINVLLSRSKHGMYIIGNSATSRGVTMWGKVIDMLERNGNIGNALDLTCPRHPDTPITVSEPEHFIQYSPEGGCCLQCGKRLQCGHPCKQKCHSEILHAAVYCPDQCKRPQKGCAHPCPKPCGDPCPERCTVNIPDPDRRLPCGHPIMNLPCWQAQDLSLVKCLTLVDREIPHCHHTTRLACHIDIYGADYQCRHQCRKLLPCGHNCKRQCLACLNRIDEEPKFGHGKCTQKCGRLYSTCAHACNAECHGINPCPPCTSPCDVQCGHSTCPCKCSEPCAPCAVSECLSSCPHSSCSMPCAAPCDHIPCSLRCEKVLSCGHQCPSVCGEPCPPSDFCQTCASDSMKETTVDFIMGEQYGEVNLAANPCIFPPCGHFLTIESMDAQMDLKKHYILDENGRPVSIASSSQPFSIDDIRTCAICRGSLRQVARYGRLVRRALLDEATKKFILYLNQDYVPMAQSLPRCISRLQDYGSRAPTKETARQVFCADIKIRLEGPPEHQVKLMRQHVAKYDKQRWKELIALREKINSYKSRVQLQEQPFVRVRNMVEDAHRRKRSPGKFDFDANVLQTKGYLQAAALSLRLDASLLADFLALCKKGRHAGLYVNLAGYRKESNHLSANAAASFRVLQQVEGNIFLAQFCALERQNLADPFEAKDLLQEGTAAIDEAERLCRLHAGQTRGFLGEIEGTRAMLRGSEFYAPVTNEERMAVLAAMSEEFRGTGHWYYCENGHPFTIGECGGAMELSRCPECGAAVGGQHHQTTAGVTRASDLENALREMHL